MMEKEEDDMIEMDKEMKILHGRQDVEGRRRKRRKMMRKEKDG